MKVAKSAPARGRPRSFDAEKALDRALQVFWRKGYQGASLSELTRAMGINRPSLYAAFGDKQALFRKVLDRYQEGPASYVREALNEPTARAVLERLLRTTVEVSTSSHNPKGCLMVQGALACGKEADPVRRELVSRRAGGEAAVRRRLERAKSEGDLPANANPADLARFVMAILHGMAVQAAGGATRAKLQTIADMALGILPNPAPPNM